MKKTLIAMAAVAVAGVASAQNATITGNFAFGQSGDTTSAGVSTRGYGTMTSNVTFAASEDLGGGMTMKASGGIDAFGEDGTVVGLGTDMSLSGGFGTIAFSSQESGDYLPVDGLTSNGAGTLADRVIYTAPAMGPVTLAISAQDDIGVIDADVGGSVGKATSASLTYSADNLTVNYTNMSVGGAGTTNTSTGLVGRNYYKAAYDLGVAAVSYGIIKTDATTDNTQKGWTVSAPIANGLTVALGGSTSKDVGGTSYSGTQVLVTYALSKRSSITLWNESYESSGTSNVKEYSLLLNHSF